MTITERVGLWILGTATPEIRALDGKAKHTGKEV